MKDLLISVASRTKHEEEHGPVKLRKTLEMLYSTCADKNNFDIQVVICSDQLKEYQPVLNDYPECLWAITTYIEDSWMNIIKAQNKAMKRGYYFFCFFPDDLINLQKDWDKHIVSKKGYFKDDCFVLYTASEYAGRKQDIFKSCYKDISVLGTHESNPVWTYKFGQFMEPLFIEPTKYVACREIIIAQVINLLCVKGIDRHVACEMDYQGCVDDTTASKMIEKLDMFKTLTEDLEPIVNSIYEYCKQ